jgi:hypothetical protein
MNAWAKMLQKIVNSIFNDFQYCEEFMLKNGINYIPARDARTLNAALVMAKDAARERNKRFANINEQRFMRKKDQFYNVLSATYGEAVLRELQINNEHFTADELYGILRKKVSQISLAMIYRNLEFLAECDECSEKTEQTKI